MGNASRVKESQEGIDEEVEQEEREGGALYCSHVQLDCCSGLTAHLNSHGRVFINAAEQGRIRHPEALEYLLQTRMLC